VADALIVALSFCSSNSAELHSSKANVGVVLAAALRASNGGNEHAQASFSATAA
jgi:hypothetical protein